MQIIHNPQKKIHYTCRNKWRKKKEKNNFCIRYTVKHSDGGSISRSGEGGGKPMTKFSSPTTPGPTVALRDILKGGGINFQRIFFGRTNLKLIKKQEKL